MTQTEIMKPTKKQFIECLDDASLSKGPVKLNRTVFYSI